MSILKNNGQDFLDYKVHSAHVFYVTQKSFNALTNKKMVGAIPDTIKNVVPIESMLVIYLYVCI